MKIVEVEPTVRGLCDVCSAPTAEVHCKVVCPNCGFTRDCSDP